MKGSPVWLALPRRQGGRKLGRAGWLGGLCVDYVEIESGLAVSFTIRKGG